MSGRLPYSLMFLYSYLKNADIKVKIIDQRTEVDLDATIKKFKKNILCFGISSFTGVQIKGGLEISKKIKEFHPEVPIVWGGWHPTSMPEQTLRHPFVDIVVRGQGEVTLKELAVALSCDRDLSNIKGISFKKQGKIYHNPCRELLSLIEEVKMPFEAVDVEKYIYKKPFADRSDRSIGIITSLGCPNNCAFCEVASVYKRHIFFRNMDNILEEIEFLVSKYKITGITIDDDNFFVSRKRVVQFCEELNKRPYKISWDAGVSVNLILAKYDDETLKLVKKSGCKQLYIGAESGSNLTLERLNKKATVEQTYEFVNKMKKIGIRASFSSMVGVHGVPESEVFETMDMILKCREINPDFDFRLFYYTPYPSTSLYGEAIKHGFKEPESLEAWSDHTLRKFKAPWFKKSYRNQVKYFYFYYFPYSGTLNSAPTDTSLWGKSLDLFCSIFFDNFILKKIAKWRVKKRFFKYPIDAIYAIQGRRLKSLYGKIIYNNVDVFYEFDN